MLSSTVVGTITQCSNRGGTEVGGAARKSRSIQKLVFDLRKLKGNSLVQDNDIEFLIYALLIVTSVCLDISMCMRHPGSVWPCVITVVCGRVKCQEDASEDEGTWTGCPGRRWDVATAKTRKNQDSDLL